MELWARKCPVILPKFRLPLKFRDLLHAASLRHGTDGFTSPPKEGVLGFFRPKNSKASAGFEPANLGTKGQHATPRPPKSIILEYVHFYLTRVWNFEISALYNCGYFLFLLENSFMMALLARNMLLILWAVIKMLLYGLDVSSFWLLRRRRGWMSLQTPQTAQRCVPNPFYVFVALWFGEYRVIEKDGRDLKPL